MKRYIFITLLYIITSTQSAISEEQKIIYQARIMFHPSMRLSEKSELYFRIGIADLAKDYRLAVWAGPKWKISENFTLAIMAGQTFKLRDNTFRISLFPIFTFFDRLILWNEFDYNCSSNDWYNISQFRFIILKNKAKIGMDIDNKSGLDGHYSVGPAFDVVLNDHVTVILAYFFNWDIHRQKAKDYIRFYVMMR